MNTDAGTHEYMKLLKAAKFKCLSKTLFFTRYFFKKRFKKKFVVNYHHNIIADALDKVYMGEITRLIINIAPRYTKTELAVKNFIAKGLALNPSALFIHLTYSDSLAKDNSEEVKDIVQHEAYREMFPDVIIKQGSSAKNKWYTTENGGVYATSAGGQVTGFGAGTVDEQQVKQQQEDDEVLSEWVANLDNQHFDPEETALEKQMRFAGAIVIDDAIKPEDANSDTKREQVNQRFDSTIRNRVNSRNTPIIIIHQRVHPQDLTGYLTENEPDDWMVISLPCLTYDKRGVAHALWEFKHTVSELLKIKKANEIVFETQYQQNPEPKEGLLFHKDSLHFYNPNTVDVEKLAEYKVATIDPADEGGDDLSAPFGYLIGDKIYITDVIYNNHGTEINEPACVSAITSKKLHAVTIEGNSAWILFAKSVRTKVQEKYDDCEIRIVKNTQNKQTRILAQSSFIKNNFIFRSDYESIPEYNKFMKCLTCYLRTGNNKHDDSPDSLAEMASFFQTNFSHLW